MMTIGLENWMSTSVGLDIGKQTVKVVELQKVFKKIKLINYGKEKIEREKSETYGTLWAIEKLFEKLEIKERNVIVHVSGRGLRHMVLDSPPIPLLEINEWIREQLIKRFPSSFSPAHLIVSFHIIEQNEQGYRLLVTYCQPQIVEEMLNILERANLHPVSIGAGSMDCIQAFIFESGKFFNQTCCFINLGEDRTSCTMTENGMLAFYQELDPYLQNKKSESQLIRQLSDMISMWKPHETEQIDETILLGEFITDQYPLRPSVEKSLQVFSSVQVGSPLHGLLSEGAALSPEYALAAGLACKKYFPLLNSIDLLPENRKVEVRRQNEKKTAMTAILGLGGMILFLMLILNTTKLIMSNRLDFLEEEMVVLKDQLFSIELIKKEQTKLYESLQEMQLLVARRSHWAELLEEINRLVPDRLWFNEINTLPPKKEQNRSDQTVKLVFSGWAFDEEKIAILISNLENSQFFHQIQLIQTDRLSSDEVWEKTKMKRVPLIRFILLTTLTVKQ